jgi:hypothetical protein
MKVVAIDARADAIAEIAHSSYCRLILSAWPLKRPEDYTLGNGYVSDMKVPARVCAHS